MRKVLFFTVILLVSGCAKVDTDYLEISPVCDNNTNYSYFPNKATLSAWLKKNMRAISVIELHKGIDGNPFAGSSSSWVHYKCKKV